MSTYQITRNGTAITGILLYMEGVQKLKAFIRADVANKDAYKLDIFMPNRPIVTLESLTEAKDSTMNARIEALAAHLGITPDAEEGETLEDLIEESTHTANEFEAEGGTYLVLTGEEADKAAAEYIRDSLWAFNVDFLASNTGLPEEVFKAMQDRCEDANETFRKLVDDCGDFDQLVSDAISSDGRAHYLNTYDGHEYEEDGYYIYRTN